MRKEKKIVMAVLISSVFITAGIFLPGLADAQEPELPPTWSQILPADDGGPDGCNSSRFKCVLGGSAVLDKETGLTWARDANLGGKKKWAVALNDSYNLKLGKRKGWRLPTIEELTSLLDMLSPESPKLPTGHPFKNAQSGWYWTSMEYPGDPVRAWTVGMSWGEVSNDGKERRYYVWPVRGGNR